MKALVLAIGLSAMVLPEAVAKRPVVIDGGSMEVAGKTYRLWGIEAPPLDQVCADAWPVGRLAAEALQALIEDSSVECERRKIDRSGQVFATCKAGAHDLSSSMVRQGMAWAQLLDSLQLFRLEEEARQKRVGLHAHRCLPAWEWRTWPNRDERKPQRPPGGGG